MKRTKEFILASIVMVLGAFLLHRGIQELAVGRENESWPMTIGKVVESRVSTGYSSHRETGGIRYNAGLVYNYTIAGQLHSARNDWRVEDSAEAKAILDKYPVGSEIQVYYSPTNPSQSTLETGISPFAYSLLIVGVCFFPAGLVILIRAIRKKVE